ncbi:hypothetical protein [Stenotrophomonas sp. PS02289]|uniref:hypothetical protein n=1 Tax=Stenotrophomonas sp. PS02289 TaxID=2991422 RepID=UPI00249B7ADB|nr:hypothetical protein [Stenotrophomonas sp. PS02289]
MTVRIAVRLCGCVVVVLLSGCSVFHGTRIDDMPFPTVRASPAQAGVADGRRAFAAEFCRQLATEPNMAASDCSQWSWPIGHAAQISPPPVNAQAEPLPSRRILVVIPGIFGECVAPWVTPFSADHAALSELGYPVEVMPVRGRASSAHNAEILHAHLRKLPPDAHAVVLAYSKGLTDFMLAASQPQAAAWRDRVSVLVSVAGVAQGSPVADHNELTYEVLLSGVDVPICEAVDGGGVASLTHQEVMPIADAFVASRPSFATYSVVAVARRGYINPLLDGANEWLSRMDERNDGQVLMEDAIIPGSTLLGVFRADHWSIALPFEQSPKLWMRLMSFNNRFPRGAVIRAILAHAAPVAASHVTIKEE